MAQSNRLPPPSPARAWERPQNPAAGNNKPSGQTTATARRRWAARAGGENGLERWNRPAWCGEAVPRRMPAAEAEGLRPLRVPLRAPPPAIASSSAAGLLPLPSPIVGSGAVSSLGRQACKRRPCRPPPRTPPWTNVVGAVRDWDHPIPSGDGRPCSLLTHGLAAPKGGNPNRRASCLPGSSVPGAATLWRHWSAQTRRSGRHGPGPGRAKPNSSASSCCGGPVAPATADALLWLRRQEPSRRGDCCMQRFRHPAPSLSARRGGPSEQPGRPSIEGALHLARWGRALAGAGRQDRRGLPVFRLPNLSATARSQPGPEALAEPWAMAPERLA